MDDYDDDEEEEPKLKYQRLGFNVATILKTDSAKCLVPHEKFLVFFSFMFSFSLMLLWHDESLAISECCFDIVHPAEIRSSPNFEPALKVLGTQSGRLYILDLVGHEISTKFPTQVDTSCRSSCMCRHVLVLLVYMYSCGVCLCFMDARVGACAKHKRYISM